MSSNSSTLEFNAVNDSGARSEYVTGAVRDTRLGKGRYDLIPMRAMRRLARHFENGAIKYGERNWRKGIPMHCYLDSAIRHAYTYLEGEDKSEDHLAAALWNLVCALHTEEMIAEGKLPAELADILQGDGKKAAVENVAGAAVEMKVVNTRVAEELAKFEEAQAPSSEVERWTEFIERKRKSSEYPTTQLMGNVKDLIEDEETFEDGPSSFFIMPSKAADKVEVDLGDRSPYRL